MSKKRKYGWLVLLLVLGQSVVSADQKQAPAVAWMSFDQAQHQSSAQSNKYLLYFFTKSCGYCRMMDEKTFKNAEVVAYINDNYTPIRIDAYQERKVAARFGVQGFPDLRFLSAQGEPIARWYGYVEAKQLLEMLKYVLTDSYQRMSFDDFVQRQE